MKKYFLILSLSLFWLIPVFSVQAATINWQLADNKTVLLIINTKGEKINTIEGEIVFDANRLKLKSVSDANSIINLWISRPQAKQNKVSFAGIISNGYSGQGLVLALTFSSDTDLIAKDFNNLIRLSSLNVLLNDGSGRQARVAIGGLLNKAETGPKFNLANRQTISAPENFRPQIIKSEILPTGDYYLVFGTQDKTTGLAYYAVYESYWPVINIAKNNKNLLWTKTESPYLLKNQNLRNYIYVKAVNFAGGVRIVKLSPQFSLASLCEHWPLSSIINLIYGSP
ncbi:MAG: hypothetical protein WC385_00645 [Candidatus Paceibacterota bacterium]|jgi:hypothetical protein